MSIEETVLQKIADGRQISPPHKNKVKIAGKVFHYRVDAYHLNGKYPFNINPNTLSADYEIWVCGGAQTYFLIPIDEITKIYNSGATPNQTPGQSDIITVDIYTTSNKVKIRRGMELDFTAYRNKTFTDYFAPKIRILSQDEVTIKKYGGTGEGEEHLSFKNLIANSPNLIGIENVFTVENDSHVFPSGDRPDIIFTCRDNSFFIVEIEIDNCLPGAYQAIKYKSLFCAEKGLLLNAGNVTTMLVARKITESVKRFCEKYAISYIELPKHNA